MDIWSSMRMSDNMTPTFDKIFKHAQQTEAMLARVDKITNMLNRDMGKMPGWQIQKQAKHWGEYASGAQKAAEETEKFEKKINETASAAVKMHNDLNNSFNKFKTLQQFGQSGGGLAYGATMLVTGLNQALSITERISDNIQSVMERNDKIISTNAKINLVNDGSMSNSVLQEAVRKSAYESRASYESTGTLVNRLNMGVATGLDTAQSKIDFANLVNKSMVIGGTEATERRSLVLQLSQSLASGKMQGDEFRSLTESAPKLMSYISQGMGVSRGSLKKLAKEGELTSDVIVDSIMKMSDTINAEFEKMPLTFGDRVQRMKDKADQKLYEHSGAFDLINQKMDEFTHWMDSVEGETFFIQLENGAKAAIDVIGGAAGWIGNLVTNHLPALKGAVMGTAVAWGSYKVAQLAANAVSTVASTIKTVQITKEYGLAAAMGFKNVTTMQGTASQVAETAAAQADTIAKGAQTAATYAAKTAQDGLNMSMAMNPIGLVISAVGTLAGVVTGLATAYGSAESKANAFAKANYNVALSTTYIKGHKASDSPFASVYEEVNNKIDEQEKALYGDYGPNKTGMSKEYEDLARSKRYASQYGVDFPKEKQERMDELNKIIYGKGSFPLYDSNVKKAQFKAEFDRTTTDFYNFIDVGNAPKKGSSGYNDWLDKANKTLDTLNLAADYLSNKDMSETASAAAQEALKTLHMDEVTLKEWGLDKNDAAKFVSSLQTSANEIEMKINQANISNIADDVEEIKKKDIDLSDESLKYLVDSMERRYVNNVNISTPPTASAIINFNGDIRETADVEEVAKGVTDIIYQGMAAQSNL